jgi:hypothetical protein
MSEEKRHMAVPPAQDVAEFPAVAEKDDNKLQHEKTLSESIDLENKQAFKGDDSDGKIDWTVRKVNKRLPRRSNMLMMSLVASFCFLSYALYWYGHILGLLPNITQSELE